MFRLIFSCFVLFRFRSTNPFHGLSAVRPVIRMDMEMDDNKRYHYEIKKRKRFDLFPLPLSFLSPSLSSQLLILEIGIGIFISLFKKKKIFKNFKIHGIYVLRGIHAPFCSHARGPFMGRRGSRKTGRNLRARINFNRVINAAHRHGKIWIEHAAAREGRAKNNISVRLL